MRLYSPAPSLLVADDDPAVLSLLEKLASSFGFKVQCAMDGQDAVDLLAAGQFDIVITDAVMPRVGGLELLAHIRHHYPQTGVIIVTGYADSVSYTDVIRAGASDFISKPFMRDELEAKLNRILREQKTIQELERLSTRDSLTDLFNRRHFDVRIWEEAHRAHRQAYALFLAMIDVDHFKDYNDNFGHRAGDNVLQSIGRLLKNCTRDNVDSCYRYGGDEFTVILPQTSVAQVEQIAERLVASYQDLGFGGTGLSVGLARFVRQSGKPWSNDIDEMVMRADVAMYQAKADPDSPIVSDLV